MQRLIPTIILTDDPADRGAQMTSSHQCDCNCACPVDGAPPPRLSRPAAYYLELTPSCNNRCPGCGNVYAADRGRQEGRKPAAWPDLIARLASHAGQFKLTGGEPTLHPAFADIVRATEKHGVPFTLFTNGRWRRPKALLRLLRSTATCDGLLVSLHGPDAAAHESFTGVPGSFDATAAHIRRAAEAGMDVAVSAVIHRRNWDRLEETLEVARGLGARRFVCNRFIGPPLETIAPDAAQLRAAVGDVEALIAAGRPVRFGNCIPQCFAPSSARGCAAGETFATVDPWGRLRPCNHVPLIAGDLRTQPIEAIWRGEVMTRWRASIPADCTACAAFVSCHGGCRAQAMLSALPRDPLMHGALTEIPAFPPQTLPLYAGLRPVNRSTHRTEGDGHMLQYRGTVAPTPPACERLLYRLDGSTTLRQIKQQYGGAALDWVGALHREGMVTWGNVD